MRSSILFFALAIGCGGGAGPKAPVLAADAPTFDKAPDSGKVDRVGSQDGELAPDGSNDLSFVSKATGPISAIFVAAVDASGTPTGEYQADTLVGNTESPKELGGKPGMVTRGLAVFEGDKVLNGTDGSLTAIGAGSHTLTLYSAPSDALKPGSKLRVYVMRADGTLVGGAMVAH
jgi:hypothetical protein